MLKGLLLSTAGLIGLATLAWEAEPSPSVGAEDDTKSAPQTVTVAERYTSGLLSRAPCVPVTDCRIVARHPIPSRFARDAGFYVSPSGIVANRYSNWESLDRPQDTFLLEVTKACAISSDYYIVAGAEAWFPVESSGDQLACTAHESYEFELIPTRNASRLRPRGYGFFEDGEQIFDRTESLSEDPTIDVATFHACEPATEEDIGRRFVPEAEDVHGPFGRGDCGALIRVEE